MIINPDHCDSSKLIEEYYLYKSHEIIRFTSDAIDWSFRQMGLEFDYERQAKGMYTQPREKVFKA